MDEKELSSDKTWYSLNEGAGFYYPTVDLSPQS